jgi:hypothetical protein
VQWRPIKRRIIKLRLAAAPETEDGHVVTAPPTIYLGGTADQYVCGHCETLLLTGAGAAGPPRLLIRCRECSALNVFEP